MKPGLYIVATPIGNLDDITIRGISVLKKSDIIFCENTKHSSKLFRHISINPLCVEKYTDHDFDLKHNYIKQKIEQGKIISLISDAGSPLISDPGAKLIKYLFENNCHVESIPGPSSLTMAIQLCGFLNPNPFVFLGFLPKKIQQKKKIFENIISSNLIFFTTSSQLNKEIELLSELDSSANVVILNEMTKIYEKKIHFNLNNFRELLPMNLKGELVVCVEFNEVKHNKKFDDNTLLKDIEKYGKKNIYEIYSTKYKIKRNELYKRILSLKKN